MNPYLPFAIFSGVFLHLKSDIQIVLTQASLTTTDSEITLSGWVKAHSRFIACVVSLIFGSSVHLLLLVWHSVPHCKNLPQNEIVL